MTRDIVIKNPSPKMIQVFDLLRDRKQAQMKKLAEMERCNITIHVNG